jgi:hypothetical protein
MITQTRDAALVTVGHTTLALDATNVQSLAMQTNAAGLLAQAVGGNVRFTLDGKAPTASTGFQLIAGMLPVLIPLASDGALKVIGEAASGITLEYEWVR